MNDRIRSAKLPALLTLSALLAGCAATAPQTPYPAFIDVNELPGVYIAGLPGVEAKQLAGNPNTRRTSNRIILPADWSFTTGASPGKSVELFVLAGSVTLGSFELGTGSYAYVPPASTGMQLATTNGAILLYFVDDADPDAVIETPLVLDSALKDWVPESNDPNDLGFSVKVMREDPGSGAKTWLLKVDPVASRGWRASSTTREGYLLSGGYRDSECVAGEPVTADYAPGGYFFRPPGATNGGPEAGTEAGAIWFMRVTEEETLQNLSACGAT